MKVEKKYSEFNKIIITLENQEELDTMRNALRNTAQTHPARSMVVCSGTGTTQEVMQANASDMINWLEAVVL